MNKPENKPEDGNELNESTQSTSTVSTDVVSSDTMFTLLENERIEKEQRDEHFKKTEENSKLVKKALKQVASVQSTQKQLVSVTVGVVNALGLRKTADVRALEKKNVANKITCDQN